MTATPATRLRLDPNVPWRTVAGLSMALVVAYLVLLNSSGSFASEQFINALTIGALYALIALGYTMVYGIIELINFAHGEVFMFGSFVALSVITKVLQLNGTVARPAAARGACLSCSLVAMIVMRHRRRRHRALRLPAAAQRTPSGTADHRHRRAASSCRTSSFVSAQQLDRHGPQADPVRRSSSSGRVHDHGHQPVRHRRGRRSYGRAAAVHRTRTRSARRCARRP